MLGRSVLPRWEIDDYCCYRLVILVVHPNLGVVFFSFDVVDVVGVVELQWDARRRSRGEWWRGW